MPNSELIIVKQLPIIEEQLATIKAEVEKSVAVALSLAVTKETYKEVKQVRAALNTDFKELENRRKAVKKAVLEPYEQFETIYKDCITNIFKPADQKLAQQITLVEDALKKKKQDEITVYFNEYVKSKGITFLDVSQVGLNITLSATTKNLKEKTKTFVDNVASDLEMLQTQPHSAETLVEYKRTLKAVESITTVQTRHKQIEEEQERQSQAEKERQALAEQKVDEIIEEKLAPESAPITMRIEQEDAPIIPSQKQDHITAPFATMPTYYEISFHVAGTMDQLNRLNAFLAEGEYQYKQL